MPPSADDHPIRAAIVAGLLQQDALVVTEDGQRRGRPRSTQAHEAILLATVDLIAEVGFDGLSMESVAARAGVGKATVYRRWPSKAELVTSMLATIAASTDLPDTGETRSDLVEMARFLAEGLRSPGFGGLIPGLAAELSRNPDMAELFRKRFLAPRRVTFRTIIERGIARGDLRADVDVTTLIDLVVGPLYYRLLISGGPIDDEAAELVVDTALAGARPR